MPWMKCRMAVSRRHMFRLRRTCFRGFEELLLMLVWGTSKQQQSRTAEINKESINQSRKSKFQKDAKHPESSQKLSVRAVSMITVYILL